MSPSGSSPVGKFTTVATSTPEPESVSAQNATNRGHTHTAATWESRARSHSDAAAPAVVSSPRSVRSSSEIASRATSASEPSGIVKW